MQETDVLQHEVKRLELERLQLSEEVQFRNDLEKGYAKRSAEQQTRLKTLKARSSALEQSMQQVLSQTAAQQKEWARKHARQMEDAALETTALKKLAIAQSKENRRLRGLAQEVLMQRNDVERFLLSSIYSVPQ